MHDTTIVIQFPASYHPTREEQEFLDLCKRELKQFNGTALPMGWRVRVYGSQQGGAPVVILEPPKEDGK